MASSSLLYFWMQMMCLHFVQNLAADPCSSYEWLPGSGYRGTMCPSRPYRDICDRYIKPNWYRVKGDAEIVTKQVNTYHCATTFPIWMRGLLPNTSTETNSTVCVNKGMSNGGCDEEISIKVKKCSNYYVYYLQPSKSCEAGYCFGSRSCAAFEPCDFYYHDKINMEAFEVNRICSIKSGWKMLQHQAQLETQCHQSSNVWMNGTNIDSGGIVDIQLCLKNGTACCDRFLNAQVKNCSGSLVFNISSEANCICSGGCGTCLKSDASGLYTAGHNVLMEDRLFITIFTYIVCYFVIMSRL